jgi:excisionase family DNA binding protein
LRIPEVAHRLALSQARVYELTGSGDLESVTIGRSRRVPLVSLIKFIDERRS